MKHVIVMALLAGLACCTPDFLEVVDRDNTSPQPTKPNVECFVLENQIDVSWDKDVAADGYYLYRDTSPTGQFNTLVYSGKKLSYTDTGLAAPQVYYYKLAKRRQETVFSKSACALAVSHTMRRDEWESNDTPEQATYFYYSLDANIFFYRDANGNKLEDVDWYWLDVPPGMSITLQIWFPNFSTIALGDLDYSEFGQNPINLMSDINTVIIDNKSDLPVVKRFKISANQGTTTSKIGSYQIKFISMVPAEP